MAFIDNVRVGVSVAAQTISGVAQNIVEKNRLNAQLNRLRIIMRNESELINRAYIALGKQLYAEVKEQGGDFSDREQIISAIDSSKQRIKKAQQRYRQLLEVHQVDMVQQTFDKSDLEDITLACSNEHEYESSPFETEEKKAQDAAKVNEKISDILKNRTVKKNDEQSDEAIVEAEQDLTVADDEIAASDDAF